MRRIVTILVFAVALGGTAGAQATACVAAPTALVLAGGGAKGFAHIGVIEMLDSLGLKPDYIVGTSVGAIMGALYASGYTGVQIDSLMHAFPMDRLLRRYEPSVSASLGVVRPIAVWEQARAGYILQSGAVREGEVNSVVSALMLRGNLLARGSFDSLPIPFRAIAADLATRSTVVLGSGDLGRAVRSSASLPVIFRPVRYQGGWLSDGGLADNVPVDAARALGAKRLWVSLLPYGGPNADALEDPMVMWLSLTSALFREDSVKAGPGDVVVTNPTKSVDNLDFSRETADSLIAMGRATAREAFGRASCLKTAGLARSMSVPRVVGEFQLTGADFVDAGSVIEELGLNSAGPITPTRLQAGLLKLGRSEKFRALWLNPKGHGDSVSFRLELETAPQKAFGVGVAFDQFMSGRLWVGGVNRSIFHGDAEGAAIARFGTYAQDASAFVRRRALLGNAYWPITVAAQVSHESVRLFEGAGELPSADVRQVGGFFGLREDPEPGHWQYEAGFAARLWREPAHDSRGAFGLETRLFRARNEYEMGSSIEATVLNDYQRIAFDLSALWGDDDWDVRVRTRAGWGNELPLQYTFPLGGLDGFAGLRLTELRGSQEAFSSVLLRRRLTSIVKWRLEVMTGAVSRGGGLMRKEDGTLYGRALTGFRAGFEASTPIGPIRLEEGFSDTGARAMLMRVGYWF
ncbi:MAG: patatin-like phospholipase family protein [Gemmatimonadetes bacterium]|nr:patatin-like phospholipase family protein [Gemmatimonadota bacterium]